MARRQNESARSPDVRPLDIDGVRTVAIVTVGWGVAFVALALRQGQLNDAGRGWWLWTCLAGVGLGLLGLEYCRRRRDAIAQAALESEAYDEDDDSGVGDWSRLPPEEEFDVIADEYPQPDEQQPGAEDDHLTQPYQPAEPHQHVEQQPGYTTGDMPVVPDHTGSPGAGHNHAPYGQESYSHTEPRPQSAPAPQQQPPMPSGGVPARPAAHRSGPPTSPPQTPPASQQQPAQRPPSSAPPQQPPQRPPSAPRQTPPAPPRSPEGPRQQPPPSPPQSPAPEPEPPRPDAYSTGEGWYDSAAGYTPEADRARRHPRDRRPETSASGQGASSGQSAGPPDAGRERPARRPLEDSEFFGSDASAPPPNSTAEFLLADLAGDEDESPPPARHDRDAPDDDDEYRGRRTRRSR